MSTYDVVIVGNGILGCATALELIRADKNLKVAVIGPGRRPGAASSAAGAMLGCFAEVTHRSLSSAAGKTKLELSIHSLDTWPMWLDELNGELPTPRRLAIKNGTYVILNSRGGRLDSFNYKAILDVAREYNQNVESVSFGDVPNLNPVVDARPLEALFLPDEGAIDARGVLDAVASVASRNGVIFIDDAVIGWKRNGNRADCVLTYAGEEIHANLFLVAAGAQSSSLLQDLAEAETPVPPMLAGKGVAVTCESTQFGIEDVVRTPNRAGGCGLHMIPGSDGKVYLGATNDLGMKPTEFSSIGMAHFLMGCAIEQLDNRLFQSRIMQWHVGNRPGSFDGFPLIGRVWQDNVWILAGTYRDGFHCSPVLARHTADTMLGGDGILGDHCFVPLRKPLSAMSRAEAIDEVSLHCISQFYEYSARPPTYMRVTEGIDRQVRARTRATYDKLETDIGLAPEVLELLNWGADREANIKYFREYLKYAG